MCRYYYLLVLLLVLQPGVAAERIVSFHSEILVQRDGSLLVEETIRVTAEGNQIKRGIYRDFPTDYRDLVGNRYRVAFDLVDVRRDGRTEPYRTERLSNGVRTYIGSENVFLDAGEHSYSIRYRTDRQLGFFEGHDELYWNVTGNGWVFPIEQASARVRLPAGVPFESIGIEGYTGPAGAKGQDYRAEIDRDGAALFSTTAPLLAHQGLTIVVTWPKGYVAEPTDTERIGYFLADNRETVGGAIGLLALLAYYLAAWLRVGRDPPPGVIFPQYQPPPGHSPASTRFIRRMGYDDKTFATALVNMAVKGSLRIEEPNKGQFRLVKKNAETELAPGESAIARELFRSSGAIDLEQRHHRRLRAAIDAHKKALRRDSEKIHFHTNRGYLIPGFVISLLVLAISVLLLPNGETRAMGGGLLLWLSGWSAGVVFLVRGALASWKGVSGFKGWAQALGASAFALPFVGGLFLGIGILATQVSMMLTLAAVAIIAVNLLFYEWLKAPTAAGRRVLDAADGFRLYLSIAEQEELAYKHPEDLTPELFERYLPFAMALDVEQQWAERFAARLRQAGQADQETYRPRWYSGRGFSASRIRSFTGTMGGSMAAAVAAASTPPGSSSGSSSGSGGGGSSGGGGGGGGGGGW